MLHCFLQRAKCQRHVQESTLSLIRIYFFVEVTDFIYCTNVCVSCIYTCVCV